MACQEELRDITELGASFRAFAAIRADGQVVTWGDPDYGGDVHARLGGQSLSLLEPQ